MKPRSNRRNQVNVEPPQLSSSPKSNPFGAAKPREQVLRQRGVDVKSLDAKFEEKAKGCKFSDQQEEKIEAVRQELTRLESLWRAANEKELPEEVYRVQAEAKREELKNIMAQFASGKKDVVKPRSSTTTTLGGFTPVVNSKRTPTGGKHYLPAKDGANTTGVDPFAAMSRHRFGANH